MNAPPASRHAWAPIQSVKLHYLLVVPVLLAIATALLLFFHSDVNITFLWSQCHSRARIHWLSSLPGAGTSFCLMVSFFQEALASARSFAVMAAILSFVAGLLTTSLVESARACNATALLIAYPTGAWLVFNLIGGAVVWELVIVPAFFRRARQIILARREAGIGSLSGSLDLAAGMRHLRSTAEIVAIPAAVVIGCVVPSLVMMITDHPIAIIVWLFFPLYVSLVRKVVRSLALRVREESAATLHLESSWLSLLVVYTVPVVASALSHGLLLFSLIARADDRKEMTRATLRFIEIDIGFIGLTVLYWLFIEAGWRVVAVMLVTSLFLGPGAGVCLGWIYRESAVDPDQSVKVVAVGGLGTNQDGDGEETPLLR